MGKTLSENERMQAFINCEEADRVPWKVMINDDYFTNLLGIKLRDFYMNPDVMMKVQLYRWEILPHLTPEPSMVQPYFGSLVTESTLGCEIAFPENSHPFIKAPIIKKPEDVDRLRVPDPRRDGLMPKIIEYYEYMKRKVGDKIKVGFRGGGNVGAVTIAAMIRGIDNFLIDVYRNPKMVHKLLTICMGADIELIKFSKEFTGAPWEGVGLGDDCAGFLPPRLYEEFAFPYNKKVFDTFGGRKSYHSETIRLDHIDIALRYGLDQFCSGTVDDLYISSDFKALRKLVGDRGVAFNTRLRQRTIRYGTPTDVMNETKCILRDTAPGGGVLVGCHVAGPEYPIQNAEAFVQTMEKYGRYPFKSIPRQI